MRTSDTIARIIREQGRTQTWIAERINAVHPGLNMSGNKLSSIIGGKRTMSGDELIAFCVALEVNPDVFLSLNRPV